MAALAGDWSGVSHLWLDPAELDGSSPTRLTVTPDGNRPALRFAWDWKHEGKGIAAVLDVTFGGGVVRAVWTDTFHTGREQMALEGTWENAIASLRGTGVEPAGSGWAWRIVIESAASRLVIRMFNISPDGLEDRAAELSWRR